MPWLLKFDGLPAHPLIVHAAVVFTPLAALAALAYALVPGWRDRLRVVMAVLVGVALVSVVAAYLSGDNFKESSDFFEKSKEVHEHEERAGWLLWATIPFALIGFGAAWWHTRDGAVKLALNGLLAIGAVAVLVLVFLTGEAGARSVWGGQ